MAKNNREAVLTTPKTIYMSEEMLEQIRNLAQKEDRSDSYIIRMLITLGLKQYPLTEEEKKELLWFQLFN